MPTSGDQTANLQTGVQQLCFHKQELIKYKYLKIVLERSTLSTCPSVNFQWRRVGAHIFLRESLEQQREGTVDPGVSEQDNPVSGCEGGLADMSLTS